MGKSNEPASFFSSAGARLITRRRVPGNLKPALAIAAFTRSRGALQPLLVELVASPAFRHRQAPAP